MFCWYRNKTNNRFERKCWWESEQKNKIKFDLLKLANFNLVSFQRFTPKTRIQAHFKFCFCFPPPFSLVSPLFPWSFSSPSESLQLSTPFWFLFEKEKELYRPKTGLLSEPKWWRKRNKRRKKKNSISSNKTQHGCYGWRRKK